MTTAITFKLTHYVSAHYIVQKYWKNLVLVIDLILESSLGLFYSQTKQRVYYSRIEQDLNFSPRKGNKGYIFLSFHQVNKCDDPVSVTALLDVPDL